MTQPEPLPPSLSIAPIAAACPQSPRLASLGLSALAWSLLLASAVLAYRMRPAEHHARIATLPILDLQPAQEDFQAEGGGGHQGSAPAPAPPPARPAPEESPAPAPAREYSPELPTPSILPTQAQSAPTGPLVPAGAVGTGNGYGSGSGSGTGSGIGTGSGAGSGNSSGTGGETLVVPYSQIGLLKVINPNYPELARRVGLQGVVVVRVTIDENGVPYAFHVVGGEQVFVKETLRVLPKWRFTPVFHDGRRVRATFDAVLRYNLA